jgi:tetratricopeptide (TPR) repeat protein
LVVALPHNPNAGQNGQAIPAIPGTLDEAQSAIERGKALLARGDFDLADSELAQAIRLAPENPEGFLLRGQISEQQGEDDRALDDYSTAVQLDVSQLLTFAQRLLAFTARRDFASAVADADQSIQVNRRLCRTCFLRSTLYSRRNEWAKAVADYNQILQLDPTNSVAYLRRGDANAKLGEWAKAVADYTESLRLDPENTETFNNRGEALLRLGQTDQALADFTAALRLDPQFAPARTNRADAHMRRGEYDQAITDYNQVIHLAPGSARPYAGRALARVEKGDWERALADLNKALALDPTNALASETPKTAERLRSAYDQVALGLNQFKRLFRQAAEGIGIARPDLRLPELPPTTITESSSATPLSPLTEVQAPQPAASTAAIPPASTTSESLTSDSRKDSTLTEEDQSGRHQRLAARHCRKGQVFQKEGDHDCALAAYTAALAVDPACVEAYRERGLIHRLARRLDEALEDFNTAIELEPSAEIFFRRGVAYAEQRQFKLAYADFNEALQRDPDHALTYLNRGLISVVAGKFEWAADDAERALEIDPSMTRARFLRGVAHGKLGRHDLAVGDFDAVLTQEPENARAHNHRGLAYAAEGKYDEAIAAYDEAIRLTPDLWAARFNRAIAYHLKGDFEGAVAAFTQFIERRPQYAPAYHQRGLAHQARNEYDAALADFTQAFQLDPNLTEAYASCMEATRLKYETARGQNELISGRSGETKRIALPASSRTEDRSVTVNPRTAFPLPLEPRHEEPTKETLNGTVTGRAERTMTDPPRLPTPPSGKLQLECPECGTAGLLDMRHLGKKFRCPGCHSWWRTSASGNLEETNKPEEDAHSFADAGSKSGVWKPVAPNSSSEASSKSGVWKPIASKPSKSPAESSTSVPATAASAAEAMIATSTPAKNSADTTLLVRPSAKPTPSTAKSGGKAQRRRKESGLRFAGLWLVTFAKTKAGRWTAIVGLVVSIVLIPFLLPSLFPSELRSRGQKVAQAWLNRDAEQIKSFADPTLAENVPRWLEATPPPDLNEEHGKAVVSVAVERNDGDTAEVLIQIKGAKANGAPAYYVFRHRWLLRKGTWYLQPDLPAAGTGGAAVTGKKDKSR